MPELPEVEVVRRGLTQHAVGATITAVDVLHPRPVRRHAAGADDFAAQLVGRRFMAARRRGKYLWIPLDNGDAILAHLGMSGQMLVQPPSAPDPRHLRVRISLDRSAGSALSCFELGRSQLSQLDRSAGSALSRFELGRSQLSQLDRSAGSALSRFELRFVDQRMFGGLAISAGGADLPAEIAHIARDPMDPDFDEDRFIARLRKRTSGVKRSLLDQTLVSGIGNIYADEALWLAGLHGDRPGNRMRRTDARRLLEDVRRVMTAALAQGGTSFDALYVNVNGESGYFDRSLEVYGQEGQPCSRCGSQIVRVKFMNRSSYYCPTCQPRPRRRSS